MTHQPTMIHPAAHPMSVDGGPVGVLLSHGFTGSPASMVPWAQHLVDHGYTVRVPRLPGHGTTWKQMNRTTWQDWYAEVDQSLTELRAVCETVVVAGLSMGGCLVLRLAEQRPDEVDGIVLVNAAVNIADKRLVAVPVLRHVLGSIPGIGNDIKKSGIDESGYDKTPLHALHSQMQMWKDVRANLGRVTQPLVFFRSVVDHVVDPSSARIVLSGISSVSRREVLLEDSYHVATLDNDADHVFEQTLDFIRTEVAVGPDKDADGRS